MTKYKERIVKDIIAKAVKEAIDKVGLSGLKATSMFASNEKKINSPLA